MLSEHRPQISEHPAVCPELSTEYTEHVLLLGDMQYSLSVWVPDRVLHSSVDRYYICLLETHLQLQSLTSHSQCLWRLTLQAYDWTVRLSIKPIITIALLFLKTLFFQSSLVFCRHIQTSLSLQLAEHFFSGLQPATPTCDKDGAVFLFFVFFNRRSVVMSGSEHKVQKTDTVGMFVHPSVMYCI